MKNLFDERCITYSQMNLINNLRIFFRRFSIWIRAYIISRYVGVGTEEELFGRLYLESIDFGDILHVIFGRELAAQFTLLLNQFTFILRDLITAQLAGNTEAVNENVNRLYQNFDEIAEFLASINPYFDVNEWKNMLHTYLQYILEDANMFIIGNFEEAIAINDRLLEITEQMGYVFAEGLFDYMTSGSPGAPPEGGEGCFTLEQLNDINRIRSIWFDLVTWVRNLMLSKYFRIGNEDAVLARLRRVPVDFLDALRNVFGDLPVFTSYQQEFDTYVDLIDALINAHMEGSTEEINRITQRLYLDADRRAAFFSSLYPEFWDENEVRTRLYNNLRSTLDESTSFLAEDFARNMDIYSTLLDQAESISDFVAEGLVRYIESQRQSS